MWLFASCTTIFTRSLPISRVVVVVCSGEPDAEIWLPVEVLGLMSSGDVTSTIKSAFFGGVDHNETLNVR